MANKTKPISLNILEIAQRVNKLEKSGGGGGGGGAADDVTYDPTASGLQATNVQDAIDEVAGDLAGLSADDVTYDNTDSGLTADTVQGAIDEVNDDLGDVNSNLNGFKFYPAGTAIVGLVSDDSPYTDANGNYILADSTTGQSMIDDVTYKSINSTVDARGKVGADSATPFKSGGGVTLVDINPTKADDTDSGIGSCKGASENYPATIRVKGYSKVSINQVLSNTITYQWLYDDGTKSANLGTTTRNVWIDYLDVPSNAAGLIINCNTSSSYVYAYTSLIV